MRVCSLVLVLFVLGCNTPRSIKLGDDSAECRKTLQRWGAKNVAITWSYGIDLSLTEEELQKKFEEQAAENDFHNDPCYVWPELGKSTKLFLTSKNGKVTKIIRIDNSKSKSGEWQRGFIEVTREGDFVTAGGTQASASSIPSPK